MLQGCLLNCALQVIRNCRDAMPFLGISRILAARQRFDLDLHSVPNALVVLHASKDPMECRLTF